MNARRRGDGTVPPGRRWVVPLALALLLTAMLPETTASTAWVGEPRSWANGSVECVFDPEQPMVNVSAVAAPSSGLWVGVESLTELRPNGSVAAIANLSGANWTVANDSDEDTYLLLYSTVAAVAPADGGGPAGSVAVDVGMALPSYTEGPSTDVVTISLSVSNWTWQSDQDRLELGLAGWPADPSAQHLVGGPGPGWIFASVVNSSGTDREQFAANGSATIEPGGPRGASSIGAVAALELPSPELAIVGVEFAAAGGYAQLRYAAEISVSPPPSVLGVPLPELLAVVAAAIATSLVLALVVRRVRGRPSRLIYADGEEGA